MQMAARFRRPRDPHERLKAASLTNSPRLAALRLVCTTKKRTTGDDRERRLRAAAANAASSS